MNIRIAETSDAENLVRVMGDAEKSGFMLFEPGERQMTAEQMSKRLAAMEQDDKSAILLAEDNGELKGYLFIIGSSSRRKSHSVYLAIGIVESSRGQGVGTRLFKELDTWANENNIRRLELTVMIQNRAGVALYQKAGFKIEGIKKNSLQINGNYIDEYYMAKLL